MAIARIASDFFYWFYPPYPPSKKEGIVSVYCPKRFQILIIYRL